MSVAACAAPAAAAERGGERDGGDDVANAAHRGSHQVNVYGTSAWNEKFGR